TAQILPIATQYLAKLQANGAAGINAINDLLGQNSLPYGGFLNESQLTTLFNQLFAEVLDDNGNKVIDLQTGKPKTKLTLAADLATQQQAISILLAGDQYLKVLRANGGAGISAVNELVGPNSLSYGGSLTQTQITTLFNQLFQLVLDDNNNKIPDP